MYTIKFGDGSELKSLGLNGNNFISPSPLEEEFFTEEKLKSVTASDEDGKEFKLKPAALVQCIPWEDGSAFILREVTEEEQRQAAAAQDVTDVQQALAELYEMILGGV